MKASLRLFIAALMILSFLEGKLSTRPGFFTFVAPGTIRSNSTFHVSVTLTDFHKPCWLNISLQDGHQKPVELKTIEIRPGTTRLVKLQVPPLIEKHGYLVVSGYRGIISYDCALLNFEHDSLSAFIQTNKAKYRPGESIQFRVICVDQLTRPARISEHGIFVLIYDGQENLIKRLSNVKLVQGVIKGDFQLSELTNLGEWKIRVVVRGDLAAEKSFTVARYESPEFYLEINTKLAVAITEAKIPLEISASYFYGESVKGNLTIIVNNTRPEPEESLLLSKINSHIDGETTIVLDIKNDLNLTAEIETEIETSKRLYTLHLKVGVIDDVSQQRAWKEIDIDIYSQFYKISVQVPKVFDSSEDKIKFKVLVSVTDLLDNPVGDSETPVKIMTECSRPSEFDNEEFEIFKTELVLENGKNTSWLNVENKNVSYCSLHAEYIGIKSPTEWIEKNQDSLTMDVLTESPEVNKVLDIKLKSIFPIGNFSYEIVSIGDIIHSRTINVPNNQTTYVLSFNLTYSMVPKITIFAHFILNGVFVGQIKDVHIKRDFQNSIEIKTDAEARPGASVSVNVSTDEGSYIGLMALDKRVLRNFKHDLTEDFIYTKLRNYDSLSIDFSRFPGVRAGLVTFSNARTQGGTTIGKRYPFLASGGFEDPEQFDKPTVELPHIRKIFSESWLFEDIQRSPNGSLNLLETVPDTITTWAITGFSLNSKTGLTLTKNATNLRVFQKFFLSFDLPSIVKEGETVEIPIYISNYFNEDAFTNLTIDKESDNLDVLKDPDVVLNPGEAIQARISANGREKITVYLKSLQPGHYNLTIKAISPIASDAVQKTLTVRSEGILHAVSQKFLVHLPEEGTRENEISIDIPANAVPGSQKVEVSAVGDIFRPLVRSLQKRARVPHGNGEENIRFMVSNLLVLKYFKVLNYTNPSLERKIRLNLELGYQNQLCFKHLDGSFGIFERTIRRTGGIWQTALALWGLHQANSFIEVDPRIRERGLSYLQSKQLENGCFKSNRGTEEDTRLTAFAVMVFLMDQNSKSTYHEVISKGLQYLYEKPDNLAQSPSSYMATYALLLGKHEKAADCFKKLMTNVSLASKPTIWKKSDRIDFHLEITVDILNTLFGRQERTSSIHIVRGLIGSKEEKSSLACMLALQAMIVFLEDLHLNSKNLKISFKDDQGSSGDFQVNAENSQVFQTIQLSDNSRRISFQTQGHGFAVVDFKHKYNLVPEIKSSSTYSVNITTRRRRSLIMLEVCVNDRRNETENNSAMVEVSLQSGYIFTKRTSEEILSLFKEVKSLQMTRERIVFQFKSLYSNEICLKLKVFQKFKVLNAKPGWCIVHSVHEIDKHDQSVNIFKID